MAIAVLCSRFFFIFEAQFKRPKQEKIVGRKSNNFRFLPPPLTSIPLTLLIQTKALFDMSKNNKTIKVYAKVNKSDIMGMKVETKKSKHKKY